MPEAEHGDDGDGGVLEAVLEDDLGPSVAPSARVARMKSRCPTSINEARSWIVQLGERERGEGDGRQHERVEPRPEPVGERPVADGGELDPEESGLEREVQDQHHAEPERRRGDQAGGEDGDRPVRELAGPHGGGDAEDQWTRRRSSIRATKQRART